MKILATATALAASTLVIVTPVHASGVPYPGPTTSTCSSGDVYVGPVSQPVMCWDKKECPYLPGVDATGCPDAVAPTLKPLPAKPKVFPGEHIAGKIVHIVPSPPVDHPDQTIFWNGHFWSY